MTVNLFQEATGLPPTPTDDGRLRVGGRGPRSLRLAGEVADGVVLSEPVTPPYVTFARDGIKVPSHPIVAYNLAAISDDEEYPCDQVRARVARFGDIDWRAHLEPLSIGGPFLELHAACTSEEEFAARIPNEWVKELAIVGTPDEGRRRLGQLAAAGVGTSVLLPIGPEPISALDQLRPLL